MHRMSIQVEKSSFLVVHIFFLHTIYAIQEVLGVMRFLGRKKFCVSRDTTTRILRCITSRNPSLICLFVHLLSFRI